MLRKWATENFYSLSINQPLSQLTDSKKSPLRATKNTRLLPVQLSTAKSVTTDLNEKLNSAFSLVEMSVGRFGKIRRAVFKGYVYSSDIHTANLKNVWVFGFFGTEIEYFLFLSFLGDSDEN